MRVNLPQKPAVPAERLTAEIGHGGRSRVPNMKTILLKTVLTASVPLCLWTLLLLSIPHSASFVLILKIALWGIPAYFFPKLTDHAKPNEFLLLNRAPQGKWIILSVIFLIAYSFFVRGAKGGINSISAFYFLSAVVISPLVEEAAFRGVLLQRLNQIVPFCTSNITTSILFLLYHVPLWIVRGQRVSVMACLWVLFFSWWMGYFLNKSKSLWTCIIIHAVQNFIFGILLSGSAVQ
jgi:membrane protease YdiL (CAAX protease family)